MPGTRFTGSLTLRDARLRESDAWPDSSGISAAVEWHGAHFHASIDRARAGAFALTDAVADWDARADHAAHFAGRLAGDAQEIMAWLRSHPQAAAWAPGLDSIDVRGGDAAFLDLEVEQPPAAAEARAARPPRVRVAALLDGAELRPVAGLPPLGALRGTLGFAAGHLQRSTLTGEWLGGPATLTLAERREHGVTVLAISYKAAPWLRARVVAPREPMRTIPRSAAAPTGAHCSPSCLAAGAPRSAVARRLEPRGCCEPPA